MIRHYGHRRGISPGATAIHPITGARCIVLGSLNREYWRMDRYEIPTRHGLECGIYHVPRYMVGGHLLVCRRLSDGAMVNLAEQYAEVD